MKKNNNKEIVKSGILLFAITVACTIVLSFINSITDPIITEARNIASAAARIAVLPQVDSIEFGEIELTGNSAGVISITRAYDNGIFLGSALELNLSGASPNLLLMLGVDSLGVITGVNILSHGETPGLGDRIEREDFRNSFVGQSAGLQVDIIPGATVSSSSVINGISNALGFVSIESEYVAALPYIMNGDIMVVSIETNGFNAGFNFDVSILNGEVVSIDIISHNETQGFGTLALQDDYLDSFIGSSIGFSIDTRSNATVTSNALINGINRALEFYNNIFNLN